MFHTFLLGCANLKCSFPPFFLQSRASQLRPQPVSPHDARNTEYDTPSAMDPQADTAARVAGTPAKVDRNADGDAEAAHVSTPSADKAMLLSSPAAFSFPRRHPPQLSSKPRKATSLFRHPASEAGKKGNDYKDVSTHEGMASKEVADGDASSSADATAEQDGEARTQ